MLDTNPSTVRHLQDLRAYLESLSDTLLVRAADVVLKERRCLMPIGRSAFPGTRCSIGKLKVVYDEFAQQIRKFESLACRKGAEETCFIREVRGGQAIHQTPSLVG